jgi:hypothetical protein
MPEDLRDIMPHAIPEFMRQVMPEFLPGIMPEDMSDRMPGDLPVTKRIDVMVGIIRSNVIFDVFVSERMLKSKFRKAKTAKETGPNNSKTPCLL